MYACRTMSNMVTSAVTNKRGDDHGCEPGYERGDTVVDADDRVGIIKDKWLHCDTFIARQHPGKSGTGGIANIALIPPCLSL